MGGRAHDLDVRRSRDRLGVDGGPRRNQPANGKPAERLRDAADRRCLVHERRAESHQDQRLVARRQHGWLGPIRVLQARARDLHMLGRMESRILECSGAQHQHPIAVGHLVQCVPERRKPVCPPRIVDRGQALVPHPIAHRVDQPVANAARKTRRRCDPRSEGRCAPATMRDHRG